MAVVVKGGFAGPGAGGVNGTGQQGVWRREITCTEVGHCIIREEVIIMVRILGGGHFGVKMKYTNIDLNRVSS